MAYGNEVCQFINDSDRFLSWAEHGIKGISSDESANGGRDRSQSDHLPIRCRQ